MEVFHLGKYYKPYQGGVEKVNSDLAETCKSFPSKVIAFDEEESGCEVVDGVTVFKSKVVLKIASMPISLKYLFNVIYFANKNILHIHMPNPFASFSLLIACLLGRSGKIVLHWHSDVVKQKKLFLFYKPVQDWLLKRSDVIVATSPVYVESSPQLKKYKNKCVVVPIGIDSLEPYVDKEKVKEIKDRFFGKKIVFSLGRHIYYKGFSYLIDASESIVDDAVVILGGAGDDTQEYINKINAMGLQDKVFLVGRVSDKDLASYYAAADVFCLPSIEKSEAFGVVQLEAMSLGTPVVSTDIEGSGVPWVNKNGDSGLICRAKDSKDLAEKLNSVLVDKDFRLKLSGGARKRYLSLFTKHVMSDEFDKIYNTFFFT